MRLSDLSYEVFREVVAIYDREVDGSGSAYFNEHVFKEGLEMLRCHGSLEYRYGSRVTMHSKLWAHVDYHFPNFEEKLVYFRFGPNTIEGEDEVLAKKLGQRFEKAVNEFLRDKNFAVEGGGAV